MAKRSRADVRYAIDLLWGHQIQRENAVLHKEFQQLQNRLDQHHIDHGKLLDAVERVQNSADQASATIVPLIPRVTQAERETHRAVELATAASQTIDKVANEVQRAASEYQASAVKISERLDSAEAKLTQLQEQRFQQAANSAADPQQIAETIEGKADSSMVKALVSRVDVLENRLVGNRDSQSSRSLIANSVEESLRLRPKTVDEAGSTHRLIARAGNAEEEEYMLTLRDVAANSPSTTQEESIDLDQNATMSSYVRHANPPPGVTDSLQPIIFNHPGIPVDSKEIVALKQGRYHSWERYLAEAQSLLERSPKEREYLIVRRFVDGLYSAGDRKQCQQWLDHNGWKWEHVLSYGLSSTPSVPLHLGALTAVKRPVKTAIWTTTDSHPPAHRKWKETPTQEKTLSGGKRAITTMLVEPHSSQGRMGEPSRPVGGEGGPGPNQESAGGGPSSRRGDDLSLRPQLLKARIIGRDRADEMRSSRPPGATTHSPTNNIDRCTFVPPADKPEPRRSQRIAGIRTEPLSLQDIPRLQRVRISQKRYRNPNGDRPDPSMSAAVKTTATPSGEGEISMQPTATTSTHQEAEKMNQQTTIPPSHQPEPRPSPHLGEPTPTRRSASRSVQLSPPLPSRPPNWPVLQTHNHVPSELSSAVPKHDHKRRRSSHSSILSFLRETSSINNDHSHSHHQSSDGLELPPLPSPGPAAEHAPLNAVAETVRRRGFDVDLKTTRGGTDAFRQAVSALGPPSEDHHHRQKRRKDDNGGRCRGNNGKSGEQVMKRRKRPPPPEIQILPTSDVNEY